MGNILPTWSSSNCLSGSGVPIVGGSATLTFQQGATGVGIGCYDANPASGPDAPITGANQACLNNSVNAINTDLGTGGKAQLPFVYYYPPFGASTIPPPVQTTGPCTVPPNGGIPINIAFPYLVCGGDSWVLGVGLTGGTGPGYGPFYCGPDMEVCTGGQLPVTAAEAYANPEPPTLLLFGAAMIAMSLFFLKKKNSGLAST